MERFGFGEQIARMNEKDLLFQVAQRFAALDMSPGRVDNMQMGYLFEELIRIGAEQANLMRRAENRQGSTIALWNHHI